MQADLSLRLANISENTFSYAATRINIIVSDYEIYYVYAIFNDQSFKDTLTNDIVSFEQLSKSVIYQDQGSVVQN